MNKYWNCTHGLGGANSNSSKQGIPMESPRWVKNFWGKGSYTNPLISFGTSLYFISEDGYDSQSSPLLDIDLITGDVNWNFSQLVISDYLPAISANKNYVVVSDKLLTAQGKEIEDLSELLTGYESLPNAPFHLGEKYIIRALDHNKYPNKYFLYDLDSLDYKIVTLPVIGGELITGEDRVYGLMIDDDMNCKLACCSIDGDVIWETNGHLGMFVVNENILLLTPESVGIYSKHNGKLLKKMSSIENKFSEEVIYSYNKSYSNDTIAFLSDDNLFVFSVIEDRLLFEIKDCEISYHCVSGDLIFTCQDKWNLVAYDRYSGEEVWGYSERYRWETLIASNNFLIAYCSTGDVVCFECHKHYISPNRPK